MGLWTEEGVEFFALHGGGVVRLVRRGLAGRRDLSDVSLRDRESRFIIIDSVLGYLIIETYLHLNRITPQPSIL